MMDPVVLFERAASERGRHGGSACARSRARADAVHRVGCRDARHAHGRGHRLPRDALGMEPGAVRAGVAGIGTRSARVWMRCVGQARWNVGVCRRPGSSGRSPRPPRARRWTSWCTRGTWRSRSALIVDSIRNWSTRSWSRCSFRRCPRSDGQAGIVGPEVRRCRRCVAAGPAARCDGTTTLSRDESLDDAMRAMGHPGRRAMLRLARDEERSAAELAEVAGLSPSAASPHLKILRETGLMHVRVDAKRRLYRVDLATVGAECEPPWTSCGAIDSTHSRRKPKPQQAGSTSTSALRVKLVDRRVFIDAEPDARLRAARPTPNCSSSGWRPPRTRSRRRAGS